MTVAIADAYRSIVITTQTTSGGTPGIATSTRPAGSFNLDAGFGISLVADPVNNKVTIVNTGNGTGALTTITNINTAGTYYPIFTRAGAPGDINPVAGTYQMDTMYLDQTTTPMTYAPSTSTLNLSNVEVTSTATLGNVLVGLSGNANFTRFPGAQMVISNVSTNQQNETGNIGLIAEGKGGSSTYGAGVIGAGYSAGGLPGYGVIGNAHVTATGDTASAIGVRGYSNDTHAGGSNIALYGYAGNGSKNYALYMTGGDIYSDLAQVWTLADNDASALSIDATGKTGILKVITTNAGEGVTMSGTLSVTGHVTLEGVTSTGATGTGTLVFGTSPSLTTPTLGAATATSVNKMAITAPASSSTLAVADGKTFTVNNTITLAGTDSTTITLPATTGTVALNNQTFFIGSTSIAINRATASQSLTGITSIDGYAAGLAGGNATTLLGSLPYQSAANTTTLLSPNVTTTKKFLRMTGDGTNGAAPAWDTVTATDLGSVSAATLTSTASSVGYLGSPINAQGAYTLVIGDIGKTIYASGNLVIPANGTVAFPIGTIINVIASAAMTIAITTDTLQWGGQATSQTGTRTVAIYGMATLVKVTSTVWYISGAGVT